METAKTKKPANVLKTLPWVTLAFLSACASTLPSLPETQIMPAISKQLAQLYPLPGGLNAKKVVYSNRPELIQTPGEIFNSASLNPKQSLSLLNGDFAVFAHHVVEAKAFDFSGFRLGLLVRPAQPSSDVSLTLHKAFVARTRPESLFIPLAPVLTQSLENPVVSGPGDAMAWARLQQKNLYPAKAFAPLSDSELPLSLSIDQEVLLADFDVPTFPLGFVAQRNALSAWLDISTTAPVELRWVAIKTSQASATLGDYQQAAQLIAGPQELPATVYDAQQSPPQGVFRFGRVAGIVQGTQWKGEHKLSDKEMESLQSGQLLAWPVATTYLKSWAKQNQSAPLIARQTDSAVESHGNYGMEYEISYRLSNTTAEPLPLQWRWTQPNAVTNSIVSRLSTLSYAPQKQIVFRGSVQVKNSCQTEGETAYHLQTQQGHWHLPFYSHLIPPQQECQLVFRWVYPPDAIPPQLLSVEKKP